MLLALRHYAGWRWSAFWRISLALKVRCRMCVCICVECQPSLNRPSNMAGRHSTISPPSSKIKGIPYLGGFCVPSHNDNSNATWTFVHSLAATMDSKITFVGRVSFPLSLSLSPLRGLDTLERCHLFIWSPIPQHFRNEMGLARVWRSSRSVTFQSKTCERNFIVLDEISPPFVSSTADLLQ